MRYVALLRGVNVNGITIRSADLKATFTDLGFNSVKTILASGNVLFDVDESAGSADLKAQIEEGLSRRFGYDAWIVLRLQSEMAAVVNACPFPPDSDERHAYVVFASQDEVLAELFSAETGEDEQVSRGDRVLYWDVARGSSTGSVFAKTLAKAKFKPYVTTRNLRTVIKLAE